MSAMQRVSEKLPIHEILGVADTKILARSLDSDYQGIVVEVTNGIEFEGTLIYFPGVQLKKLQEG